jgi:hypothetical protein
MTRMPSGGTRRQRQGTLKKVLKKKRLQRRLKFVSPTTLTRLQHQIRMEL